MQITITPISNNASFRQNQYAKTSFKVLRELPSLNCACCGEKTINPESFRRAIAAITLPLKKMLKEDCFQSWKKSLPIWDFLTELSKKYPEKSLDQLEFRTNSDIKTDVLDAITQGILAKTKKGYSDTNIDKKVGDYHKDILHCSRACLRSASVVMKRLSSFKECLNGEKLEAFEQLEIYAQKYPRKTLSEIINMDKIYKLHEGKNLLQRTETREKSDYHFDNIAKMVRKINPKAYEWFPDLKDEALDLLVLESDINARLPKMKLLFKKFLEESGCERIADKVYKELEQIPMTYNTKDSFFVHAHNNNYSDFQIISAILKPSVASVEHILPRSKGGPDIVDNTIVLCEHCNSIRGNTEYSEFIQYHPRMPYNTQKQLLQISQYILKGHFQDDLKFYPFNVAKTLEEYTAGRISPDLSEYCKKGAKVFQKKFEKNIETINKIKEERQQLAEEKEALLKRLAEIDDERALKKKKLNDINSISHQDYALRSMMQDFLDKK